MYDYQCILWENSTFSVALFKRCSPNNVSIIHSKNKNDFKIFFKSTLFTISRIHCEFPY